jgi:hypothetical protein
LISSSGFDTSSSKLFKALIRPYSQKVCQPHKTFLLGQETLGITKWSHHKQRHPQVHVSPCNYFIGSHSFLITKWVAHLQEHTCTRDSWLRSRKSEFFLVHILKWIPAYEALEPEFSLQHFNFKV